MDFLRPQHAHIDIDIAESCDHDTSRPLSVDDVQVLPTFLRVLSPPADGILMVLTEKDPESQFLAFSQGISTV